MYDPFTSFLVSVMAGLIAKNPRQSVRDSDGGCFCGLIDPFTSLQGLL